MAIGVGLVQFWPDWSGIALIIGIFAAGQFIEGNFLSPKLVGGSIGLHPVWLMFALFAFGYVFGFVGLLLAVPMAAAAGVLVRYGLTRYLGSRLYTGARVDVAEPRPIKPPAGAQGLTAPMTGQQLTLDLSHRPALAREDFLVSPSNATAVAHEWPNWPTHGAVIVGAPGSGKSHLASVWQQRTGAALRKADTLSVDSVADDFASGSLVVEDADAPGLDERALFHALNLARQQAGFVLLTSARPVGQWPLRLPDLVSRLKALPEATILPP